MDRRGKLSTASANGASDENSEFISEDSEREELEISIQNGVGNGIKNGSTNNSTALAISETGLCSLCGKISVCKCERCGDFYCSPQCQRKDWPNHRFICFPMPRLIKTGQENSVREPIPTLKAETKSVEISKEESRQAFKARQLSFVPSVTQLPPDGSTVILTGFKSANRCYIRSADPAVTEEYKKNLKKLDNFGKTSNDVTSIPKANTYALTQKDDQWCRVQILSARPDNRIRVQFIDYGTVGLRYMTELRRISNTMSSLPNYVHMVQLHNVTVYSMETKFLEHISQNVGKEFKMRIVDSDSIGGNVELYYTDTQKLLNTEILTKCQEFSDKETTTSCDDKDSMSPGPINQHNDQLQETPQKKTQLAATTPGKIVADNNSPGSSGKKKNLPPPPRQIPKPCMVPPFEIIPFEANTKNVKMVVVDNSYVGRGYLGCILEKDLENLQAIQKFLYNYDGSGQPYKPKVEEYCIAEFQSGWYRGKVVEVLDEDKFLVAYIDFTNECELTSAAIRRYPMSLTLPCCTNLCAIEGLPEDLSDDLIEFLEKEFDVDNNFKKLKVDNIKVFEDLTFIESKELLKKLRDAKLI
ncbi:veneno [Musca autumnalis]|uniref:veneno n=1 Tax=Musca autumnalis TaxID=221902 RepID=UPI003CE80B8E